MESPRRGFLSKLTVLRQSVRPCSPYLFFIWRIWTRLNSCCRNTAGTLEKDCLEVSMQHGLKHGRYRKFITPGPSDGVAWQCLKISITVERSDPIGMFPETFFWGGEIKQPLDVDSINDRSVVRFLKEDPLVITVGDSSIPSQGVGDLLLVMVPSGVSFTI